MNRRGIIICATICGFLVPTSVYAADPEPVTPSSVTGRVLPLPLKQAQRRIRIGWEISPSASVTHYCIYYRKTSPPISTELKDSNSRDEQPCYDIGDPFVTVKDTDDLKVTVESNAGPNGRDMWYVTISNLDYERWYIFQITANKNSASCTGCVFVNIDNDNFSYPSPFKSYGVYIPKSTLKWEEYTE